jgi:hypothetical protein
MVVDGVWLSTTSKLETVNLKMLPVVVTFTGTQHTGYGYVRFVRNGTTNGTTNVRTVDVFWSLLKHS